MTNHQIHLVKTSWSAVAQFDPVIVGEMFYRRLFQICPEVRPMFTSSLPGQSKKLLHMLNYVIKKLDRLEDIIEDVKKLAIRHGNYGVKNEHYAAVGAALLWTLRQGLGEMWTMDLEAAWTLCYQALSSAMMMAAAEALQTVEE